MDYGGIERLICMLEHNLRSKYNITICCLDSVGPLGNELKKKNEINVVCLHRNENRKIDLLLFYRLYELLKRNNIHILHTHNEASLFYGSVSAYLAGTPVIVSTEHSRHYINEKRIRSIEKKAMSYLNNKIVCVSDELKKESMEKDKIQKSKLCTILNGIDNELFNRNGNHISSLKKQLDISKKEIVIGIVARLNQIKNHQLLINAFQRLVVKGFPVKLLIIGDGPLNEFLKNLVCKLNLKDRVLFLGSRNDVPEWLSILDIFVLCSLSEGFPLTVLEAMSAGLPTVVTTVGANREIINDGVNGFLVPPNHIGLLEEKLTRLILDENLRVKIGMEASITARKYDIRETANKYDKLYMRLLGS